jgi:DNA uptake protein ComE-like DNA-binding protein
MRIRTGVFASLSLAGALFLNSCGWSSANQDERNEKIRDEAAKAAEKAKPAIQEAAKKAGEAARTAAEGAKAAAQGAREGWERSARRVDINSATEDQLAAVSGISRRDARRIIAHRPYSHPRDLVDKGVLSEEAYAKSRDLLTTR